MKRDSNDVKILRKTPVKGWRAVYAVPREGGGAKFEQERISVFALCEDEQGHRFVSGIGQDGELCALRDDFVGHFSLKDPWRKVQDAFWRVARGNEYREMGDPLAGSWNGAVNEPDKRRY
jgi:hypothetical protein